MRTSEFHRSIINRLKLNLPHCVNCWFMKINIAHLLHDSRISVILILRWGLVPGSDPVRTFSKIGNFHNPPSYPNVSL